eukprot:Opistho-1_new@104259
MASRMDAPNSCAFNASELGGRDKRPRSNADSTYKRNIVRANASATIDADSACCAAAALARAASSHASASSLSSAHAVAANNGPRPAKASAQASSMPVCDKSAEATEADELADSCAATASLPAASDRGDPARSARKSRRASDAERRPLLHAGTIHSLKNPHTSRIAASRTHCCATSDDSTRSVSPSRLTPSTVGADARPASALWTTARPSTASMATSAASVERSAASASSPEVPTADIRAGKWWSVKSDDTTARHRRSRRRRGVLSPPDCVVASARITLPMLGTTTSETSRGRWHDPQATQRAANRPNSSEPMGTSPRPSTFAIK